ncbi:MAG: type III pantothenate kinase [Opitutales bacterium]
MKLLCLDIGNTRAHYGLAEIGGPSRPVRALAAGQAASRPPLEPPVSIAVLEEGAVSTASIAGTHTGLPAILRSLAFDGHLVEGFSIASVVPDATEKLRPFLESESRPIFQISHRQCPGLEIDYPKPAEIGQDRLALALGAQAWYGAPTIVVDMGTAVTLDILDQRGAYVGGVIAPGLAIMTRYLHEQTALLPELDPDELAVTCGIGKSTVEAMQLGCVVGFEGMLNALLERVRQELTQEGDPPANVVMTGGSAGSLTANWSKRVTFDGDLLLRGLAEAFRRWQASR